MSAVNCPARPLRITFVLTHPVQYQAPWLRHISATAPELELTVLYGAIPTPEQQGAGFNQAFTWDVPLTDGYRWEVCARGPVRGVHSDAFWHLDVEDIGQRITATTPDVVLVAGWHSAMQVRALRACRRLGIPVLYRGDSTVFSGPRAFVRPLWRLKTRALLRQFSGYLSVGQHSTAYLRSFAIPDSQISHSPHCVDNERFVAAAAALAPRRRELREAAGIGVGDFVVLFAGKFQQRKRPVDAVRAVATLGGGAVLLMAGDGPLSDEVATEATRLGVRLIRCGFMNQSTLPEAFAAADCLLVPSTWETWGLIVNEALASGLPCVVTGGVAAAPDLVVEGETGFCVPVGDTAAMGVALATIRGAQERGFDYAPACRRQVDTCSFTAATRGLVAGAQQVVARVNTGTIHVA